MKRYFVVVPIYFFGDRYVEAEKIEEAGGVKVSLDDLDEVNFKVYLDSIAGEYINPNFYGYKCLHLVLEKGDMALKILPKDWEELKKKPQVEEII